MFRSHISSQRGNCLIVFIQNYHDILYLKTFSLYWVDHWIIKSRDIQLKPKANLGLCHKCIYIVRYDSAVLFAQMHSDINTEFRKKNVIGWVYTLEPMISF